MKSVFGLLLILCLCVGGCGSDEEAYRKPVSLISVYPPGGKMRPNMTIRVTFDAPPRDVTVSVGTVKVVGNTAMISGPFTPPPPRNNDHLVGWASDAQLYPGTTLGRRHFLHRDRTTQNRRGGGRPHTAPGKFRHVRRSVRCSGEDALPEARDAEDHRSHGHDPPRGGHDKTGHDRGNKELVRSDWIQTDDHGRSGHLKSRLQ